MRFAYIDSQGKEVGIPSVEALQLRIELGAIGEETMFFDSSTDKWAPAKEHEIFRTLSREAKDKDEGGFVAPPPPTMLRMRWPPAGAEEEEAPPPPPPPGAKPPSQQPAAEAPPASPPPVEPPAASPPAQPVEPPAAASPPPPEPQPTAETPATEPPAAETPATDSPIVDSPADDDGFGGFGDLGLTAEEPAAADAGGSDAGEDDAGGFDFGDFGALDLEPVPPVEEPAPDPTFAAEPEPEAPLEPTPAAAGGEDEEASDFDFGGGLEMDGPAFPEEDEEEEPAGGMPMEKPLSSYSPDEPPSWMAEQEGGGGLELEDAAAAAYSGSGGSGSEPPPRRGGGGGNGGGGGDDGDDDERRERPKRSAPRARPAVRPKKSKAPAILGTIVLLAVLGGGGWFGWNYLQSREAAGPVEPEVFVPEIPSYLESTLAEATGPAFQSTIDSLRALAADIPAEPHAEWLSGNYLANANQFGGVQQYWNDMEAWIDEAQDREEEIFMVEFEARLDSLQIVGEDRAALEERARAGFQAARPDRRDVYLQLSDVIVAALDLHDFVLANEDQIEYSPVVGGLSRDPVTEAVPSSEALGRELWDQVADITTALDNLGALDRVSTDRLLEILLGKLARVPLRGPTPAPSPTG